MHIKWKEKREERKNEKRERRYEGSECSSSGHTVCMDWRDTKSRRTWEEEERRTWGKRLKAFCWGTLKIVRKKFFLLSYVTQARPTLISCLSLFLLFYCFDSRLMVWRQRVSKRREGRKKEQEKTHLLLGNFLSLQTRVVCCVSYTRGGVDEDRLQSGCSDSNNKIS